MKNIYNVFVPMTSQAQCDRMKQLCIDNGLPYEKGFSRFLFTKTNSFDDRDVFRWSINFETFNIWLFDKTLGFSEITESEFIELLKTTKK